MFREAFFSCNLQQHRQKQHTCISPVKYIRHHGNSIYYNDWIVLNTGLDVMPLGPDEHARFL